MSRRFVLPGLLVAACAGCIVQHDPPPDTEISFVETQLFGAGCGTVTSWSVDLRELGQSQTGGCEDEIDFHALDSNATYTFDISGYEGQTLCWQGSCTVPTEYGVQTYGDCSAQIKSLCH
ncbi:MAG TPA: hypothetical protein VF765_30395 [Polyangiaceae bacterium]